MYKARMTRWKLDKNSKENEMKAMVRKHKQRQNEGKESVFLVRGKTFTYKDLVRYWERKRLTVDDIVAQRSFSKTPEAVRCVTPVPRPITPPRALAIPERILACTVAYHKGSFESGAWAKGTDVNDRDSISKSHVDPINDFQALWGHLNLACDLFANNEFEEAGQALITGTSNLQEILTANDHRTVQFLCSIVLTMNHAKRPEIASAILRYLNALGEVILGRTHPLSQVCGLLASIEQSQLESLVTAAYEIIIDVFESELGPFSFETLSARLSCIEECVLRQNPEQSVLNLKGLLQQYETRHGLHDSQTFDVREILGYSFFVGREYRDALQIYQYTIDHDNIRNDQDALQMSLWYSGLCWIGLHEIDRGEENMKKAIAVRLSQRGPQDAVTRRYLLEFENHRNEWGRLEAAARVREQRRQIMELSCEA